MFDIRRVSHVPMSRSSVERNMSGKPVKGKGNLLKVPTKAEVDHDNSIAAMRWVWRSFSLLLALPLRSML